MINQQILDYIKQQLQQGIPKETISSNLLSQGWLQQDVNEAFSQATAQNIVQGSGSNFSAIDVTEKSSATNIKWIVISVILLLIITGAIYLWRVQTKQSSITNQASPTLPIPSISTSPNVITPPPAQTLSPKEVWLNMQAKFDQVQ